MTDDFEFLPIRTEFTSDSQIDNSFFDWPIDHRQCFNSTQSENHSITKELEYNRGDEFNGLESQVLFSGQNMNSLDNVQFEFSHNHQIFSNQLQLANTRPDQNSEFAQSQDPQIYKKRFANCFLQCIEGKNVLKKTAVFEIHNMICKAANVPPVEISYKYSITQYYKDFAPFQDQIIDAIEKNIEELRNAPTIQQIYSEYRST